MDDSLNLIPVALSEYVKSLNHEDVAFYIEKLTVDRVQLPDPYGIAGIFGIGRTCCTWSDIKDAIIHSRQKTIVCNGGSQV
jgi:hypothetical protein